MIIHQLETIKKNVIILYELNSQIPKIHSAGDDSWHEYRI